MLDNAEIDYQEAIVLIINKKMLVNIIYIYFLKVKTSDNAN